MFHVSTVINLLFRHPLAILLPVRLWALCTEEALVCPHGLTPWPLLRAGAGCPGAWTALRAVPEPPALKGRQLSETFQPDKKQGQNFTCYLMECFPPMLISLIIFPFWGLEGNSSNSRAFPGSTLAATKRTDFDHLAFQGHRFCCTWLVQGWSCWGDCGAGSWLLWGPSTPQSGMWWGKGQSQPQRGCWRQLHDKSNGMTNISILEINTHFSFC